MREYTVWSVVAVVAVLAAERWWWRTGLLRTRAYRVALGICLAFQLPVDGWLTKASATIVAYDADEITGWRIGWDSPVEDFLFGFALLTMAMALWVRAGRERQGARP